MDEQVEDLLNAGLFRNEEIVSRGFLDGLRYEDEIIKDLEGRTSSKPDKLKQVSYYIDWD